MKRNSNVVKMKSRRGINIGVVIFLFILIYIGISVYFYLTKSHLSIYEVQEAALAQDNIAKGVIVRNETIVRTDNAGYVNYFYTDGARVAKDTYLYTIDETKTYYDTLSNADVSERITENGAASVRSTIASFREKFNMNEYSAVSDFQTALINTIVNLNQVGMTDQVDQLLNVSELPSTFHVVTAVQSGIISYHVDSLCGLTLNDISEETFTSEYEDGDAKLYDVIEKDGAVCSMIDDGTWYIVCQLDQTQYESVKDLSTISIVIQDDGFSLDVPVEIIQKDSLYFAKLTLSKYMIRYYDKRFLSIELNWQVSNGYKIPVSAITTKEFYLVPNEFFMYGGDTGNIGITIENIDSKTNEVTYEFKECAIYYDDGVYSYIDTDQFSLGDNLFSVDGEYYSLSIKESLQGVYNVNKGYAMFRRIEPLYQNDDYCIVAKNTQYGLSLYDHIALVAATAVDAGIIY